jgi:hypothetical protein
MRLIPDEIDASSGELPILLSVVLAGDAILAPAGFTSFGSTSFALVSASFSTVQSRLIKSAMVRKYSSPPTR